MDSYDLMQMLAIGFGYGAFIGFVVGWLVCGWVLTRGLMYLGEKRLTPEQREQFGGLMLKIMGKE